MLEIFLALLCLGLVFLTPFLGVAITLLTEKWLGLWAYALGWAVPVILVSGVYALYDIALRLAPCEPADRLACGEPLASAFVFLVTWLCVILIANFFAQVAVYLFLYTRREAEQWRQAQLAEEAAPQ
jgi:hypothetical protein